jgi:3-deoxy-D-manno-octulosonic-acid transferase
MSVLPLITELLKPSDRHVLVTSGTVGSAKLMAERLPTGAVHQYAPVDTPSSIRRFLDHWRPEIALFVDSEIWPNMVSAARGRGTRIVLVNGRMSAKSFSGWRRLRKMAAALLNNYDLCLAQDQETAERLIALGAPRVRVSGNLKADAPPLPADADQLANLREAIAGRPVLLAVSTHPGEEEIVLPVHDTMRRRFRELLTIIAPRHPERGETIAMLCGGRQSVRRSVGTLPDRNTAVYIADTLGELGLLYRIAPFAFVGGSLVRHGGQNPLEPARLQCGVLAGPHTGNFTAAYDAIFAAQGAGRVGSTSEMAIVATRLIENPGEARTMGEAAASAAESLGGAVERTRKAIEQLLTDASS